MISNLSNRVKLVCLICVLAAFTLSGCGSEIDSVPGTVGILPTVTPIPATLGIIPPSVIPQNPTATASTAANPVVAPLTNPNPNPTSVPAAAAPAPANLNPSGPGALAPGRGTLHINGTIQQIDHHGNQYIIVVDNREYYLAPPIADALNKPLTAGTTISFEAQIQPGKQLVISRIVQINNQPVDDKQPPVKHDDKGKGNDNNDDKGGN